MPTDARSTWSDLIALLPSGTGAIGADVANFPVYVDLSALPAAFWSHVQADGGDIRVTESDGVTRRATELVTINAGTSTGELHFLAAGVSSTTDSVFRIYYGSGLLSQPAVADTYGRNAVWASYEAVFHLQEDPAGAAPQMIDSTGNGHDLTTSGAMTTGDLVAAQIGDGLNMDGSNDEAHDLSPGVSITNVLTLQAWANIGNLSATGQPIGLYGPTGSDYRGLQVDASEHVIYYGENGSYQTVWDATARTGAGWTMVHGVSTSAATHELFVDGSSVGSRSQTWNGFAVTYLGVGAGRSSGTQSEPFLGALDEVRIRLNAASAMGIAAEYANQSNPTTFFTVGAETPA